MSGSENVTAPSHRARVRQDVTHHWKNLQLQQKKEKAALKTVQWWGEDSRSTQSPPPTLHDPGQDM